jgi:hypothetical protein
MAYTDDAKISVLQKAEKTYRKHRLEYPDSYPKIKDIPFEGDDEIDSFNIAMEDNHIYPFENGEFMFDNTSRYELYRLLEKKEALRREEMSLRYAQQQANNSLLSFRVALFALLVAFMTLVSSIIYFYVTARALLYPIRPDIHNIITVPNHFPVHKQYDIPHKHQKRNCHQNNNEH